MLCVGDGYKLIVRMKPEDVAVGQVFSVARIHIGSQRTRTSLAVPEHYTCSTVQQKCRPSNICADFFFGGGGVQRPVAPPLNAGLVYLLWLNVLQCQKFYNCATADFVKNQL